MFSFPVCVLGIGAQEMGEFMRCFISRLSFFFASLHKSSSHVGGSQYGGFCQLGCF